MKLIEKQNGIAEVDLIDIKFKMLIALVVGVPLLVFGLFTVNLIVQPDFFQKEIMVFMMLMFCLFLAGSIVLIFTLNKVMVLNTFNKQIYLKTTFAFNFVSKVSVFNLEDIENKGFYLIAPKTTKSVNYLLKLNLKEKDIFLSFGNFETMQNIALSLNEYVKSFNISIPETVVIK